LSAAIVSERRNIEIRRRRVGEKATVGSQARSLRLRLIQEIGKSAAKVIDVIVRIAGQAGGPLPARQTARYAQPYSDHHSN
jgi:hypothetical protein